MTETKKTTVSEKDIPKTPALPVTGIIDRATVKRFEEIEGLPKTGYISGQYTGFAKYMPAMASISFEDYGCELVKRIASSVPDIPDTGGIINQDFIEGLQKYLVKLDILKPGSYDHGILDKSTAEAIQNRLNTGEF